MAALRRKAVARCRATCQDVLDPPTHPVAEIVNVVRATAMEVTVGIDDLNQPSPLGDVRFDLLAGVATTISAQDLERGDARFSGLLGDEAGKWRLEVWSDQPIQAMSLLRSPTGNITNLSRWASPGIEPRD